MSPSPKTKNLVDEEEGDDEIEDDEGKEGHIRGIDLTREVIEREVVREENVHKVYSLSLS